MPKGYIVAHIDVKNPEAYPEYVEKAGALFSKYNATILVRGGKSEQTEGLPLGNRTLILETPSFSDAQALYHSEEYQEIAKIRHKYAISSIFIVEGV